MSSDAASNETFLARWSRRKHEQRAKPRRRGGSPAPNAEDATRRRRPLPPVDELTFESDFTGFMHPKVDGRAAARGAEEAVQRPALQRDGRARRLHRRLTDAPSRSPDELLKTLNQARTICSATSRRRKKPRSSRKRAGRSEPAEAPARKPMSLARQDA